VIISVLISGFVIDMLGVNDFWLHRGQGYMQKRL
jgi:hypothetical protein